MAAGVVCAWLWRQLSEQEVPAGKEAVRAQRGRLGSWLWLEVVSCRRRRCVQVTCGNRSAALIGQMLGVVPVQALQPPRSLDMEE